MSRHLELLRIQRAYIECSLHSRKLESQFTLFSCQNDFLPLDPTAFHCMYLFLNLCGFRNSLLDQMKHSVSHRCHVYHVCETLPASGRHCDACVI
jgi:hypothetical protein